MIENTFTPAQEQSLLPPPPPTNSKNCQNNRKSKEKREQSPSSTMQKKRKPLPSRSSGATAKGREKSQTMLADFFEGEDLEAVQALCKTGTEDDPPLIFLWRDIAPFLAEVQEFLQQEEQQNHHHIAPPFPLPNPLTPQSYKHALLSYVRAPDAAAPQCHGYLPCTIGELGISTGRASALSVHPWFMAFSQARGNGTFPMAEVMVPRPRSNKLSKACESAPFGVPLWV